MTINTKTKIVSFVQHLKLVDVMLVSIIIFSSVFLFLFFSRKASTINIKVKVTDQDVLTARNSPASWYARQFEVGDVEKDSLGNVISEITGVESFETSRDLTVDNNGRSEKKPSNKTVYLDLKVKTTYDSRTQAYAVRGKSLAYGVPMRFRFSKITFDGLVVDFPGSQNSSPDLILMSEITVLQRNVDPYIANTIAKGDTVKNSNGVILVEVKNVEVVPAEKVVITALGDLLLKKDPLYKDVKLGLSVQTKIYNGEIIILDELPLRVGQTIPLVLPSVSLNPFIIAVND